jgi:hypothetical protein
LTARARVLVVVGGRRWRRARARDRQMRAVRASSVDMQSHEDVCVAEDLRRVRAVWEKDQLTHSTAGSAFA